VEDLAGSLNGRGYRAEALHGGMGQEQRDRVMARLRSASADLIVATDVAARGLDIEQLTHVINYNVPPAPESYVHRVGRVGRAGREGVAITLVEPREHRMLQTIERVTKRRITVEKVPTVADLRARRLELTRAAIEESIVDEGDLERFRVVVESLADEFDVMEVALAAVKLAHEAGGGAADEEEIPEIAPRAAREARGGGGREPGGREPGGRRERRERPPTSGMTRLFVGAGRSAGVRPQDLVGAIAGESNLSGRDIGAIEITDRFSLVEVPESAANDVIAALRGAAIKGRKTTVRRERPR
jgi:ATP-dependent RNA helicase DeaD